MDYSVLAILVLTIITAAECDWVEIPQSAMPLENEKESKQPDVTSYLLTTSSTTVPTPILSKPTITDSKKSQRVTNTKSNKTTMSVDRRASAAPVKNKLEPISVQNVNNIVINDTVRNDSPKSDSDDVVIDDEDSYEENENVETTINDHKGNEDYGYSYASFIPYMSTIQSTLMKNAHKNKKSKVGVLKHLRDHLLAEISNRMVSLWKPNPTGRGAREYKDDSHVDFPSNEGALMTIGFLTFAVFLIKLVLQLIQTISHKMESTNTEATFIGRKRRSAMIDEESIKILNYIEQYSLK